MYAHCLYFIAIISIYSLVEKRGVEKVYPKNVFYYSAHLNFK